MLVAIARDGTHEDQQHAADSLWRLSRAVGESRADEHLVGIVRSGGVSPLVTLLRDGTAGNFPSSQTHGMEIAAVLLLGLARYDERLDDDHPIIDQVTCAGAIPCLVALVRDGTAYGRLKAAQLLETVADYVDYSEGMCTTPHGGCGCVAVMRAGGIVPLIAPRTQSGPRRSRGRRRGAAPPCGGADVRDQRN